ncbi:MAG: VOC family protein [Nitratireductor sp.]|nr:VOC family protein [Nitratireductor sp.]
MEERRNFAHVCLLVKDIHAAIDHYSKILGVLDPQQTVEPLVYYEDFGVGEERLAYATFPSPGCEIQLMQPKTPGTALYRRLEKLGEHVHHICFTSPNVHEMVEKLAENDIGIVKEGVSTDPQMPWQHWTFVDPRMSHGVLIEIANDYDSVEGKWGPADTLTQQT